MSPESRQVVALVGAGMVAKTHVAACLAAQEKVWLKAITSRSIDRAKTLASYANEVSSDPVAVYDSVSDIASDLDIDFVIVATPPNVRKEIIEPLVKAGKHILLEKPIGRTLSEAREIVDLCESAGVSIGIVFQHRARAASVIAAELCNSNEMGRLSLVELSVPWWREQAYYDEHGRGTYERDGGGVLISQAIHTIDLALSLTGPVSSVTAMAKTTTFHEMESEDFVVAGIEFENGAIGSLTASTASFPGSAESITLHFDLGSLHLESGVLTVTRRDGDVSVHGEQVTTGGGADPMAFTHEWHQTVIENFALVAQSKATPIAPGREALAAHELIDSILTSAKNKRSETLS